MNLNFNVILIGTAGATVTQTCPSFRVPKGATVRVYANNRTTAGNAEAIQIGQYDTDSGDVLQPGNTELYPVPDTGQIHITGKVGDGAQISVKA